MTIINVKFGKPSRFYKAGKRITGEQAYANYRKGARFNITGNKRLSSFGAAIISQDKEKEEEVVKSIVKLAQDYKTQLKKGKGKKDFWSEEGQELGKLKSEVLFKGLIDDPQGKELLSKTGLSETEIKDMLNFDAFKDKYKDEYEDNNKMYKIQNIAAGLRFQRRFAPGGFRSKYSNHIKIHQDGGAKEIIENLDEAKIIFSNEAFGEEKYPSEGKQTTYLIPKIPAHDTFDVSPNKPVVKFEGKEEKNKEFFSLTTHRTNQSVTELRVVKEPDSTEGYTMALINGKYYFTSHFASIEAKEREKESEKFASVGLRNFLKMLFKKSGIDPKYSNVKQKFGGFAGDINLYLTQDDGTTLRDGVRAVLQDFDLVLFTAAHKINKGTRAVVQEQWQKIKGEEEKDEFVNDSLIVIEPYSRGYNYRLIPCHMNIFFPKSSRISEERKEYEPFGMGYYNASKQLKEDEDKVIISDHFYVQGKDLIIFSGADMDGIGNEHKATVLDFKKGDKLYNDEERLATLKVIEIFLKNIIAMIKKVAPTPPTTTTTGGFGKKRALVTKKKSGTVVGKKRATIRKKK